MDAQWNVFKSHFHNPTIQDNIRSSKEEQYQGEFLIDLFVNVLGYTKNPTPNFNLTTEYKNVKDSKKADLMLTLNKDLQEQSQKFQRTIKRKFFSTTPMGLNPLENTSMLNPLENTSMLNPLGINLPKKLQD